MILATTQCMTTTIIGHIQTLRTCLEAGKKGTNWLHMSIVLPGFPQPCPLFCWISMQQLQETTVSQTTAHKLTTQVAGTLDTVSKPAFVVAWLTS